MAVAFWTRWQWLPGGAALTGPTEVSLIVGRVRAAPPGNLRTNWCAPPPPPPNGGLANHTSPSRTIKIPADIQKISLAEIISPWLVICWAIQPDACCSVIPIPCSWLYICCALGLNGFTASVSCAWCIDSRFVHRVVVIDVPMEPASVRVKFDRLDAAARRSGGRPESVMVVSGIKKHATAKP